MKPWAVDKDPFPQAAFEVDDSAYRAVDLLLKGEIEKARELARLHSEKAEAAADKLYGPVLPSQD